MIPTNKTTSPQRRKYQMHLYSVSGRFYIDVSINFIIILGACYRESDIEQESYTIAL
jgi:hypothetical protein